MSQIAYRALAIETSGRLGSVALVEDGHVLVEETFPHGLQHAARIIPVLDTLCRAGGWMPRDLDELYVSAGPGSFTGLRIGITLAKTLALASGLSASSSSSPFSDSSPSLCTQGEGGGEGSGRIADEDPHPNPLPAYRERGQEKHNARGQEECGARGQSRLRIVAVPTVRVLAENAPPEANHLVIVLDAKRDQIFTARFERDAAGWVEREPAHLDSLSAMLGRAPRPVYLLGEGIPFHTRFIPTEDRQIVLTEADTWRARAAAVAAIGWPMARAGQWADPLKLIPIYIRRPEAEEKFHEKNT